MELPVPTNVPVPHPALYHFHAPPVPVEPCTVSVVVAPAQRLLELALTDVGPQGNVEMEIEAHADILHALSART
jgi:hypothetical protein